MKHTARMAIVAMSAALCVGYTYGQSLASNTNAALVIQATNASTTASPAIEIAPEIRAEMLRAAAEEIGSPGPNDLDDLLSRHAAMKQKVVAIQARQTRASTNAAANVRATAPVTASRPVAVKAQRAPTIEQLDQVIAQLSEIRSQLGETPSNQAAK